MNALPVAARHRRTAGFAAVAVATALLTSACAAGRDAQTASQDPSQEGVNATVGAIALRGISLAAPSDSNYYAPGSDAVMSLVLVNTGSRTDALTAISSSAASGWGAYSSVADGDAVREAADAAAIGATPITAASSGASSSASAPPTASQTVRIEPGSRTSFGVPDAQGSLLLLKTKGKLYPASTIHVTFTFARAGTITVRVPIGLSASQSQETIAPPSGSEDNG